jgi:MoaA/NifB/PqqE/SkfB family radical SAM enzyme
MRNIWKYPTSVEEEVSLEVMVKLPQLAFCNITGGELLSRDDIREIIAIVRKKAKRIVISTNAYLMGYMFQRELKKVARDCMAMVIPSGWYENNPRSVRETFAM